VNVKVFPLNEAVTNEDAVIAEVTYDDVAASNPSNLLSTDVENARGSPKPFIVDADIEVAFICP
jgi:hypothetical protein